MLNRLIHHTIKNNRRLCSHDNYVDKSIKHILNMNVIRYESEIECNAFKLLRNCNDKDISLVPHTVDNPTLDNAQINNFKKLKIDIYNKYDILDVLEYQPYNISNIVINNQVLNNMEKMDPIFKVLNHLDIKYYLNGKDINSILDLYYIRELKIDMCLLDTSKIFNNLDETLILCVSDELLIKMMNYYKN